MRINSGDSSDPSSANEKYIPKDAQVVISILKDMGIQEFEPRVVNQFLEFSYGYMTTILEDAKLVSGHAKKKAVDADDVKLSVQMYVEENLTAPPNSSFLLEAARTRNANPLPMPRAISGMRLPPDRFCITATNYRLAKTKNPGSISRVGIGSQINPSTPRFGQSNSSAQFGTPVQGFGASTQGGNRAAMPLNIQVQPGGSGMGNQPAFRVNINPSPMMTPSTGQKRKASSMMDNSF